jgi:nitrogen fixation NifU-like protein
MPDLRELYQQVILDHNRAPRNFGSLTRPTRKAEGYNPLCGDRVAVEVEIQGDVVRDIAFRGSGCAISRASASMMTASVKGKPVADAEADFERFHRMLTTDRPDEGDEAALGKLTVFATVREFPSRVKCATLPWHTMRAALAGRTESVSTE